MCCAYDAIGMSLDVPRGTSLATEYAMWYVALAHHEMVGPQVLKL